MKLFGGKKTEPVRRGYVNEDGARESRSEQSHFRRNQTIGGLQRSGTGSDESSRQQTHQLTIRRRKVGGVFLIVFATVILLLVLLTQFTAQVKVTGSSVAITSSFSSHESEYIQAINEYYGTHPAERLRFLLNVDSLSSYISSLHSEVSAVKITEVSAIVEAKFTIIFREPVAAWQIRDKQNYVDSEGVVFERNYYANPTVRIVDESGINPEQGTAIASSRLLGFVGKVVSLSKSRGYTAVQATLPADTTRRLDVRFEGVAPVVRFSIDGGAGEQVSDMVSSLEYMSQKNISASYVDVRVDGRTVYK